MGKIGKDPDVWSDCGAFTNDSDNLEIPHKRNYYPRPASLMFVWTLGPFSKVYCDRSNQ